MNALSEILKNYAEAHREGRKSDADAIAAEAGLNALHLDLVPEDVKALASGTEVSRLCSGELFLWTLNPEEAHPIQFLQRREGMPSDPPLLTGAATLHARFRHGHMLLVL